VTSNDILAELLDTLAKPYLDRQLAPEQRAEALLLLESKAILTPVTVHIAGVATHPEDDLVLAAAVSAHADYLVTGDTQLRQLEMYQGIRIVNPREFLALLEARNDEAR
jgi:putative PIN family toxin of toxin-antitoxin system